MVTFQVLGPLRAEDERVPLALKGPRHRALLARLLIAHGRVVPLTQLIDDLWEQPPRDPHGTIQTFVSDIRRILEPDRRPRQPARVLVTAAPGYALHVDTDQVDADRFESLVRAAVVPAPPAAARPVSAVAMSGREVALDVAVTVPDLEAALSNLDLGLALWSGPAYAEFSHDHWARAEITRLDELHSLAIEQRALILTTLSRHTEAVAALESHLHTHPLREPAWHTLALALYRAGRQADALAALRAIRRNLRSELGVDPGLDLRHLESDILAQSPQLAVAPPRTGPGTETPPAVVYSPRQPVHAGVAAGSSAGGQPAGNPFVGRLDELARMRAAAERVAETGSAVPVLVSGIEGAGKSALAEALSVELAQQGWKVAWGPSPAERGAPPNWPWTRISAALSAVHADRPALDGVGSLSSDPAVARFHSQRAAVEFLGSVARGGPVLVVFDDLHWAGEETLELLTALAMTPVAGPVLLVGTYRGTDVEAGLAAALARLARVEPVRVQLGGLGVEETGELVRAVAGAGIGAAAVGRIHGRGQGNPFYTRELARLWRDEGEPGLDAVPVGVRDVVRHRLERLSEAERRVLRQAAVIGSEVDFELLVELSGDGELADAAVAAALRAGFLSESGSTGVAFAHALVRDVVYRDIPAPRRSGWHAQAGTLLEAAGTADAATLAHHFVRAATTATAGRAGKYSRAAASAAERVFAPHEAARLWGDAVTAYERAGDVRSALEATMGLVRALALTGRLPEAGIRRAEAIRAAERLGDPALTARLIVAFDVPALWTDTDDPALARLVVTAAERALHALPLTGSAPHALSDATPQTLTTGDAADLEMRCRLLITIALELRATDTLRGRAAAEEAESLAAQLNRPALLALALNARFMQTFHRTGLAPERAAVGTRLIELSQAHDLVTFEVLGHLIRIQALSAAAEFDAADHHVRVVDALADRYGLPLVPFFTTWYAALRTSVTAPLEQAEAAYRSASAAHPGTAMPGLHHGLLPMALLCLRLRHGKPLAAQPDTDWGPHEPWIRPLLHLDSGDVDAARAALLALSDPPPDLLLELRLALLAHAALALTEHAVMRRVRDQLSSAAGELAGAGTGLLALAPVDHYLDRLNAALG
ncbi:BTAD domain-containing putative transcriptional regulator [Nocardia heshunensis]